MKNSTNRDDGWRNDIRETNAIARSVGWRAGIWIVAVAIGIGILSGGIWAVKVATSDVRGAGDATRITNDGRNRVNAQEWFHSQYAAVLTADRNLDQAAADLRADPKDPIAKTNLTGLRNRCVEMVNNYNAEAGKVSRGKWLDSSLPQHIDGSDPAADCRETPTVEGNPR